MKKIIFIILLFLGLALLNSCAKPEVVNVAMPQDNQLTCEQLDDEMRQREEEESLLYDETITKTIH